MANHIVLSMVEDGTLGKAISSLTDEQLSIPLTQDSAIVIVTMNVDEVNGLLADMAKSVFARTIAELSISVIRDDEPPRNQRGN